jgi:hypothetical protein
MQPPATLTDHNDGHRMKRPWIVRPLSPMIQFDDTAQIIFGVAKYLASSRQASKLAKALLL